MKAATANDGLSFEFDAELWRYSGKAAWYFVSLPPAVAEDIRYFAGPRRGFGSIRVIARIGASRWNTSIFPDSKRNTFLLPVKAAVRRDEGIDAGAMIHVALDVLFQR